MRRITFRFVCSAIGVTVCLIFLSFITSNSSDTTGIQESQPVNCNCSLQQGVVPKIIPSIPIVTQSPITFRPCIEVQKTSPVQRAIIIYYPHHQGEYFFPEVRW